jgi:hypothetical protein
MVRMFMGRISRSLVIMIAFVPGILHAQTDTSGSSTEARSILLDPSPIRITDHFEAPRQPTEIELAIRSIGAEIEQRREAERVRSSLQPFWQASLWKYIPSDPGRTLNSAVVTEDDPFFTPVYLNLSTRLLGSQMEAVEKRGRFLFEH